MSARRLLLLILPVAGSLVFWGLTSGSLAVPESKTLRGFVFERPLVPVIFTSRTNTKSLQAAADEGEGFIYPGLIPWQADEGRLRLIHTDGTVYELTWGRTLSDGSTLIDVMSPTVSIDGRRVLFAGRKCAPDAGRWRIYEVGTDGSNLRQLTGLPGDPGCVAVPPMRFGPDGSLMSDEERRRIDFDDIDPVDLGPKGFAFASSRIPDLGRDHARRATQIWTWHPQDTAPGPITANRNNDRWPYLLSSDHLVFSLWSRIREGVTEDRTDVRPFSSGGRFAFEPSEGWMGAQITPNGAQFGYAVKSAEPVWRPRPLFNGRIAFMTPDPQTGTPRLAQADWGYIRSAPSSVAFGTRFPDQGNAELFFGPTGAGCPSAYPNGEVVFSRGDPKGEPGSVGLYVASEDWSQEVTCHPLFDDPTFCDSEPVAVYPREVLLQPNDRHAEVRDYPPPRRLTFLSGEAFFGPVGYLENLALHDPIRNPIPWNPKGLTERVDPRRDPLVPPPPGMDKVAFFASRRDRFDDPVSPRIHGQFERILSVSPKTPNELTTWVPSDSTLPTTLAGLDADGRVVTWPGRAKDANGNVSRYVAYAGDHFSGAFRNGYHYCNGCHSGHTFVSMDAREKRAR